MERAGPNFERRWILLAMAPALLAVLEIFHPEADDLLKLPVRRWLVVHYAQVPLFALSAMAVAALVRGKNDIAAWVCRISVWVFAVTYMTFDTNAGISIGILSRAAQASPDPAAWAPALNALWTDPLVGGVALGVLPSYSVIGRLALSLGTAAAAVSLRRRGCGWGPVLLLALAGCGLNIFHAHSWPGGPVTFGGIALAIGWLARERARVPLLVDPVTD